MKPLLNNLIHKEQSTFIQGRNINDKIVIANELAHSMFISKKNAP